jgi:hypothetical protein
MEIKVGDRVVVIKDNSDTQLIGLIGTVIYLEADTDMKLCHVKFDNIIDQKYNRIDDYTHTFFAHELKKAEVKVRDFKWALEQMKEGKKVKRNEKSSKWYVSIVNEELQCTFFENSRTRDGYFNKGETARLKSIMNFEATDWEIYEEKKKETLSDHINLTLFGEDTIDKDCVQDYIRIIKREISKGKDPIKVITEEAGNSFK